MKKIILKHGMRKKNIRHTKEEITEYKKLIDLFKEYDRLEKSYMGEYFQMEVIDEKTHTVKEWINESVDDKKDLLTEILEMDNFIEIHNLFQILDDMKKCNLELIQSYVNKIPNFVNVEYDTLYTNYSIRKVSKEV